MVDAKITLEYKDFKELEGEAEHYKKEYNRILSFLERTVKVTDGECLFKEKEKEEEAPCSGKSLCCTDCEHFTQIKFEITDKKEFGIFLAELLLDR